MRVQLPPSAFFIYPLVYFAFCSIINSKYILLYRGIEQMAARQAHNLEVVGSSPTPATRPSFA